MSTNSPLAEQIKALEHLQELDLKIDNLNKNKMALPAALKTLDDALAKLDAEVGTKKAALDEIDKAQKQTRAALDLNRDRLGRSTMRLDGVQNTQEYNALNKEIEQLKKMNASLEEQLKKAEDDTGVVNKSLADLDLQIGKIRQDRETQAEVLNSQGGKLETEINQLLSERAQLTVKVEKRTLALYDRVRGARAGLGFVPAVAGRCKGCNMVVPPQLYNEIRKVTAIHSCPSCHRLLFVPGDSA